MKVLRSLAVITLLCVVAAMHPNSLGPIQNAWGAQTRTVECYAAGDIVHDGAITPTEYGDSYFDPASRILTYFACEDSSQPVLHVGIVSPWYGWVGFMTQASDVWDGGFNEIRISYEPSSRFLQAADAYQNVLSGVQGLDPELGGSLDILDSAAGATQATITYEFTIPLLSEDPYDSRLRTEGPFNFAIQYSATEKDVMSKATGTSPLHSFALKTGIGLKTWTYVEIAVPSPLPLKQSSALASLRDGSGKPIPAIQLVVFVRTVFGFFDFGTVWTNQQGVARIAYLPRDEGAFLVGVAYEGTSDRLASVQWCVFEVEAVPRTGDMTVGFFGDLGVELRPLEALIVVVVTAVWASYLYAFFSTRRLMRKYRKMPIDDARHVTK